MPDLDDLIRQGVKTGTAGLAIVRGRIANTPADDEADLFVTIPAFDGNRVQWGPCPWCPRNILPVRGDPCLVLFDDEEQPFVLLGGKRFPGGGPARA